MPFAQLRALVISVIGGGEPPPDDEFEREFDAAPTTYRPSGVQRLPRKPPPPPPAKQATPRMSTLDELIASLQQRMPSK